MVVIVTTGVIAFLLYLFLVIDVKITKTYTCSVCLFVCWEYSANGHRLTRSPVRPEHVALWANARTGVLTSDPVSDALDGVQQDP